MSDTEDEPFDKEAEKEKLRQQLAQEEEARQSTQHMSELLLKGATMTNRHCDQCGDPLFRYEGREFCPTCGRQRAAGDGPADSATAESTDETLAGQGSPAPEDASVPDQSGSAGSPSTTGDEAVGPTDFAEGADLPAARQALERKVTSLAREAETTSDVGRARELLAAVREGAEALRALEGSHR